MDAACLSARGLWEAVAKWWEQTLRRRGQTPAVRCRWKSPPTGAWVPELCSAQGQAICAQLTTPQICTTDLSWIFGLKFHFRIDKSKVYENFLFTFSSDLHGYQTSKWYTDICACKAPIFTTTNTFIYELVMYLSWVVNAYPSMCKVLLWSSISNMHMVAHT